MNYEDYFMSCIEDLFRTYQSLQTPDPIPLIINTPPSLYTTHFPLLTNLLSLLKPCHLIHLGNTAAIDQPTALKLDTLQTTISKLGTTLHELTAQGPPTQPSLTDANLRAMHMQSYFHLASLKQPPPSAHGPPQLTWTPRPLSTLTPWEFHYEETPTHTQDLLGFLLLAEPIAPSHLLTALNGSIVHILETTDPDISRSRGPALPRTGKYRLPYFAPSKDTRTMQPLDPRTSRLVCTALIRGFEPQERIVQVLVPRTHDGLVRTLRPENTVFVAGCCDMPEWAYVEDAYAQLSDTAALRRTQGGGRFIGDDSAMMMEGMETPMPPWVERESVVQGMGYLNAVRRVRKFHQ